MPVAWSLYLVLARDLQLTTTRPQDLLALSSACQGPPPAYSKASGPPNKEVLVARDLQHTLGP